MRKELTRRQFGLASVVAATAAQKAHAKPSASDSDIDRMYQQADATTLAEYIRAGDLKPQELLEHVINRAEVLNPKINAITMKHYDLARDYLKGAKPSGRFAGVPFLIKDLGVQLKGTVTTGGSRLLADIPARRDDVLVSRYKKAGLVIFGKTNTPEFGMALTTESYLHGACRNPWNLQHSTGGSSGGSAAAVTSGIVPMAHATDGGGSIRVPASACGVFGFKTTRALTPCTAGPSRMSVSHLISRSVRDSAGVLEETAGYEPGLPFVSPIAVGGYLEAIAKPPKQLRVALVLDEPKLELDGDVKKAILKTAKTLEGLGHVVEAANPGINFDELNAAQNVLMVSEFSRGMKRLSQMVGRPLDDSTMEDASLVFIREGEKVTAAQYLDAYDFVQGITRTMANFHLGFDIMLSPVTVTPAPKLNVITERAGDTTKSYTERFRQYSAYTPLQNLTGVPSASLPVGLSESGLPVAAMLSAALGQDALLMSVCKQLEAALPFESRRPLI